MTTGLEHRVFVVDDNPRFALRVYRFLSEAFEFGMDVADASKRLRKPLHSPDGCFALSWHDPTAPDASPEALLEVLARERLVRAAAQIWVLLDVRYAVNERAHALFEDYLDLLRKDESPLPDEQLRIISSYRYAGGRRDLASYHAEPKSLETLQELRNRIYQGRFSPGDRSSYADVKEAPSQSICHVLITGAGFELREADTPSATGMPPTGQLIFESTPTECGESDKLWLPIERDAAYPLPIMFKLRESTDNLNRARKQGNLDDYWDLLLEVAHAEHLTSYSRAVPANRDYPRLTARLELSLRDAFRRSLLKYDTGHTWQHVIAAKLPWAFWLTTNYTRFIDRALSNYGPNWRVLRNPVEANSFLASEVMPGTTGQLPPTAIKLHGDIGEIHSMAIAGSDKRALTQFFVRPALHTMYVTAAEALLAALQRGRYATCRWHVVGHGLRDRSLLELLRRVMQRTSQPGIDHELVLVGPCSDKQARARELADQLYDERGDEPMALNPAVWIEDKLAHRYLAQLAQHGIDSPFVPDARISRLKDHA